MHSILIRHSAMLPESNHSNIAFTTSVTSRKPNNTSDVNLHIRLIPFSCIHYKLFCNITFTKYQCYTIVYLRYASKSIRITLAHVIVKRLSTCYMCKRKLYSHFVTFVSCGSEPLNCQCGRIPVQYWCSSSMQATRSF